MDDPRFAAQPTPLLPDSDANGVAIPADGSDGGNGASLSNADREYISEQIIGQTALLPSREPLGARLAAFMGRRHGVLMALCALLLWGAMTLRPPGEGELYQRGEIAKDNIFAPRAATVLDRQLTLDRKREAASLIPTSYDGNPTALTDALAALREIAVARQASATTGANNARRAPVLSTPSARGAGKPNPAAAKIALPARPSLESVASFNRRLQQPLSFDLAARLLQVPAARWPHIERAVAATVRAAYLRNNEAQSIRSDHLQDDLAAARLRMRAGLQGSAMALSPAEQTLVFEAAKQLVRAPNFVANTRKTERARQEASNRVPAAYIDIRPGALLVEAGARIDDEKWAVLQDMDLVAARFDPAQSAARLILCLMLVAFCAGYVMRFQSKLIEQPSALWLTAMLPVAFVVVFRFLLRVPQGDQMMVPLVATCAMLLTILLNARIGLLVAFVMASLCAVMARADSGLFLATSLAASVGVLSVSEIASYRHLARAALVLALTNAILAGVLGVLREAPLYETTTLSLWAALAGAASVGLTYCLAMFVERPFGITTHLRLLELSAPDEIVMRRMQVEAPGTYTHSLMVAQLSEAAAKAVGADPLLCRVGGLYHDIGKLRRPHCFVENQVGENVHDRLSPQMSALLIVAHVKDGLELGRALHLPVPVLDIIAQHHGTTLIAYFYHRANQRAAERLAAQIAAQPDSELPSPPASPAQIETDEALFRYPGPKPQSKEAAIVLLADTIEASSRALPNMTPERLEEHIKAMTAQRLQDGELSECLLTLRDLQTIEGVFAHVLRGVFHHRIEYPDPTRALKEGNDTRDWTHETLTDPLIDSRFQHGEHDEGHDARAEQRPERRTERRAERRSPASADRRAARNERNAKSEKARSETKSALSGHLRHRSASSQDQPKDSRSNGKLNLTNEEISDVAPATNAAEKRRGGSFIDRNGKGHKATHNVERATASGDDLQDTHHLEPERKAGHETNGHAANGHAANGHQLRRIEPDNTAHGARLPEPRAVSQSGVAAPAED